MKVSELLESWNDALLSLVKAPIASAPEQIRQFVEPVDIASLYPRIEPVRLQWRVKVKDARADERFRYRSPLPSGDARNDIVFGQRWRRPDARLSGTALLLLHAAFAPNHSPQRWFTRSALRNGAHVYLISLPYHMRRQPEGSRYSGHFLLSGDVPRLIRSFLQGVGDTRALLRSLRHVLGYRRVLLGGVGFGGTIAALAAIHEPVEGLFLVAPVADPFHALWSTPLGEPIKRSARSHGFADDDVRSAMRCITLARFGPPQVDRRDVHVVYGADDVLAAPHSIRALLEHWGEPPSESMDTGHQLIALRLSGLERRLGEWVAGRRGAPPEPR